MHPLPALVISFFADDVRVTIIDELLKSKKISGIKYKVHLYGNNQLNLITGKGLSNSHETFYFPGSTLGAVNIDNYKYRFVD